MEIVGVIVEVSGFDFWNADLKNLRNWEVCYVLDFGTQIGKI